jgi:hypothetical protein
MQRSKRSFVLYYGQRDMLEALTLRERGQLLTAIYDYAVTGVQPPLRGAVLVAFQAIRAQLDCDRERYDAVCEENRRRASLRWQKEKTPAKGSPTEAPPIQASADGEPSFSAADKPMPAHADACHRMPYDTDTDTDTETETETDTDTPLPSPRAEEEARGEGDESAPSFDDFWQAYPKKINRRRAREAWSRALLRSPGIERGILSALSRAKRSDRRFQSSAYTPHPANWLADEPWRDPPPMAPPGQEQKEICRTGSFDTDEFFARALARTYGSAPSEKGAPHAERT